MPSSPTERSPASARLLTLAAYVSFVPVGASTVAVALSGVLVARFGFRFAIQTGLLLVAVGLGLLMAGPRWLAVICIAAYGAGNGVAVPAANLMVAELNPGRRSATLNWLNFCWSTGAVACPFLVSAAAKAHHVPIFLIAVGALSLVIAVLFTFAPAVEPRAVAPA